MKARVAWGLLGKSVPGRDRQGQGSRAGARPRNVKASRDWKCREPQLARPGEARAVGRWATGAGPWGDPGSTAARV